MNEKKLISVVTPTYNEEENIEEVLKQVKVVFGKISKYDYEHIFIDNDSTDNTVKILKNIAQKDKNVKIIVNAKNFGSLNSPYHGMLQANGDAIVSLVADLQDPPSMIKEFLEKWEEGYKVVIGIKPKSQENPLIFMIRKLYYRLIKNMSESEHISNFSGFGLYDREFIDILRNINDPSPYFRGLVAQYGFEKIEIEYVQPKRERGKTSNNFYKLYDAGMLGFVNHTKIPLRLATFIGFGVATLSLIAAIAYLIYKLIFWNSFNVGVAPLVIGLFFFSSIQLFFIGIVGEYIGAIYTQVKNRPIVIEKERINFDKKN